MISGVFYYWDKAIYSNLNIQDTGGTDYAEQIIFK